MAKHLLSLVLLAVSVCLSFKHGWDTLHYKKNPETLTMLGELGISASFIPAFVALTFAIGGLLLIPKTFFYGNLLSALSIVLIMALALREGNLRSALLEIPFLVLPLIMIWLKYPFSK